MSRHHHLYNSRQWRSTRLAQITAEPLCRRCLAGGLTVAATVADHVVAHRGDVQAFWNGDLQSLCASCHSSAKQRQEKGGWDSSADLDGYPVDPNHPANL